jgi:ectoine hydroxylase-related dioxygenase (phytanoyl-CoA dioxygenase family)
MVVPGSHRFKSDLPFPDLPFPDITYIQDMPHAVALPTQAGTVAILHGNLYQARTRNLSDVSQRFLDLTYVHCWMRHALPKLSQHAIDYIGASPNLSQLFALRDVTHASRYWSGQLEGYSPSNGLPDRQFSPLTVVGRGHEPNK